MYVPKVIVAAAVFFIAAVVANWVVPWIRWKRGYAPNYYEDKALALLFAGAVVVVFSAVFNLTPAN